MRIWMSKSDLNKPDLRIFGMIGFRKIMRNGAILAALATTPAITPAAAQDGGNLITGAQWVYFADTVMGGVSEGRASFSDTQDGQAIRLWGDVSTANNGGFIQVRADIRNSVPADAQGIVLRVRGNNEGYVIHLRTRGSRLPWQYYQGSFTAGDTWQEVRIPFDAFKASGRMMRALRPQDLVTLGIVAYGRDYQADLYVSEARFY